MSRRLLAAALLLLCLGAFPAAAAEEAKEVAEADATLVRTWLAAKAPERHALSARIRERGPTIARALRAAIAAEAAAPGKTSSLATRRLESMLARVRVDLHRAHTPAGMVYIPAGPLEVPRDSAPWGPSGERRMVGAFYLDRTELTVKAWRAWLAKLEAAEPGAVRRLGLYRVRAGVDERLPAVRVRHVDAVLYAKEHGARLPTADEFERAVRGSGLATWPWGSDLRADRANLLDQGPGRVMRVGSYPKGASAFGALDLVGNVAEWSSTVVPSGRRGHYALLHGGSYIDAPEAALTWRGTSRRRARVGPRERQPWIGFRLARDVPKLPE